jgi:hypothetical protein
VEFAGTWWSLLQFAAFCCNLLQFAAICCNLLQPAAIFFNFRRTGLFCSFFRSISEVFRWIGVVMLVCILLQSATIC